MFKKEENIDSPVTKDSDESALLLWVLKILCLLPILLWPLVYFSSIFLFDDPNGNPTLRTVAFYAINSYPLFLVGNLLLAHVLFSKHRKIAIALLLWPITLILIGVLFSIL